MGKEVIIKWIVELLVQLPQVIQSLVCMVVAHYTQSLSIAINFDLWVGNNLLLDQSHYVVLSLNAHWNCEL